MSQLVDNLNVQKSPKSPAGEQSEKSKKYDRQLRLWGDHGQQAIENAHVCLINATATGTEFLKSVVLPGIGAFTVIDGGKVTGEDVGCNFFFEASSIGSSRAKVATQLLLEMNTDVRGDFIEEHIEAVLDSNPKLFTSFTVVVATGVSNEKTLVKLSQVLWQANVPLLVCKSYGFIGYMRLQIMEHPVIESHPDSVLEDLRLDEPFLELKDYLDSFDLNSMNKKDLAHTPYLIVLYKFLLQWQSLSGKASNQLPANYKEKVQLRELITTAAKDFKSKFAASEGEESLREIDLDNFDEAAKAVNTVLVKSKDIPSKTKSIIETVSSSGNAKFWLLIKALDEYVKQNGSLPLRGTLPDMTADSARYIQLQKIYSTKAKEDAEAYFNILQVVYESVGRSAEQDFSDADIKLLCKNARFLNVVRTSPLFSEYTRDQKPASEEVRNAITSADLAGDGDSLLVFYLLLRSTDKFYTKYNRHPGDSDDQVDGDVPLLKSCFKNVLSEIGVNAPSKDDYIQEMVRFGGSELHSVAAFVGGCAAQEAIKLVTGQYVPFNNTFVYNAMSSTTHTFEL